MNELRAALAGLTTRGRCLLSAGAALAGSALLLGQRDLMRAGLFLLVLPLAAGAVVSRTRYRLACTRTLEPPRVPAARRADVRLQLDNVSRLPSGLLLLEDAVPYTLGVRPRFVLDRVEAGGRRQAGYAVSTSLRGRYRIGPLRLRVSDPFGLCELARAFHDSDQLVVTPAVTPLPPGSLAGDWTGGGDTSSRATAASGSDDVTTREYRHGDDLRKVHWRSTARTGELMVRREEQPVQSRVTLLLDTRAGAHRGDGPGSSFEWAVSAVASVGASLARTGALLRLVVDDDRELVPPGLPLTEPLLLDVLADVELGEGASLVPAVERLRRGVDGVLVAVVGLLDEATAARLARLRQEATGCVALLLDTPSWVRRRTEPLAGQSAAERALLAAGWRVTRVAHGASLADAWSAVALRGPLSSQTWTGTGVTA